MPRRRMMLIAAVVYCSCCSTMMFAAMPVTFGGATMTFDNYAATSDWYTRTLGIPGTSFDVNTVESLDQQVQTFDPSDFVSPLAMATAPLLANRAAMYDPTSQLMLTYPTSVIASALVARLQNATGGPIGALDVAYTFGELREPTEEVLEEIRGHRIYYRLAESASWTPLTTIGSLGAASFRVPLGSWQSAAPLYLLWVDDNALAQATVGEPAHTIDNVQFSPVLVPEPSAFILMAIASSITIWIHRAKRSVTNISG